MKPVFRNLLMSSACFLFVAACNDAGNKSEVKEKENVAITVDQSSEKEAEEKTEENNKANDTDTPSVDLSPEARALLARTEVALAKAGETKGDGDPALWKMSDDDTTIYLYGTVHILPDRIQWQTDEMNAALEAADTLIMEIDSTEEGFEAKMAQLVVQRAMLSDGKKIQDILSEKQIAELSLAMEDFGLSLSNVETMQPWFIGLQIQVMAMMENGYNPEKGVEQVLTEAAKSQGMGFSGFETAEQQMEFLASESLERQIESLMFSIQTRDKSADMMDKLLAEWVDGDLTGLSALVSDPELMGSQELYDVIIKQRNQNWIPQIEALLEEPGTKFVAVGAAHLVGPDSVVTLLENQGHEITVIQ